MKNKKTLFSTIVLSLFISFFIAVLITCFFSAYHLKEKYLEDHISKIEYESEKIYLTIKDKYKYIFFKTESDIESYKLLKAALKEDLKRDLRSDFKTFKYDGFIYEKDTKQRIVLKESPFLNYNNLDINLEEKTYVTQNKGKSFIVKKVDIKPFSWVLVIIKDMEELERDLNDSIMIVLLFALVLLSSMVLMIFYILNKYIKKDISKILSYFDRKLRQHEYEKLEADMGTKEMEELKEGINSAIEKIHEQNTLLIQQSKMASMGEMIGNIAHQWRQPLNALSLSVQKIKIYHDEGILSKKEIDKAVLKSKKLIDKMSTTIDDFRNFFKVDKMKQEFNINSCIESTLELLNDSIKHHNIEVLLKLEEDSLNIYGYKNELEQVLLNIINNAKDILLENEVKNPIIEIITKEDSNNIYIVIKDNGGGVPKKIIDDIFNPYFTTKDEGKGTGIGLYMSKMIVQSNMHGDVSVENIDEGASFTIALKKMEEISC